LVDAFLFEGTGEDAVEADEQSDEEFMSELDFKFSRCPLGREASRSS